MCSYHRNLNHIWFSTAVRWKFNKTFSFLQWSAHCTFKAFLLFDLNGDGCIDEEDLRATFGTLGEDSVPEGLVEQMMSEVCCIRSFFSIPLKYTPRYTRTHYARL